MNEASGKDSNNSKLNQDSNKAVDVKKTEQGAQSASARPASEGNQSGKPSSVKIEHGFTPDPKAKHRHREIRKLQFLDCYYDQITISHACAYVGVSIRSFYEWQQHDKKFARAYDLVWQAIGDRLMRMTYTRAMRGSDNLAMFMLKFFNPSFRDRVQSEIDPKVIENLVNTLVDALKKSVPNACPHCKTNLGLTDKVAQMLGNLSKGVQV